MTGHILKVTVRGILRNKTASLINIGGLASAMSVCILIGLWISRESGYDKIHDNYDRIAKVRQNIWVWPVFFSVGLGCLVLTVFTVSFKAIKTASISPVNALKTE